MAKMKLGELIVDFESNPRGKKDPSAILEYADAIRDYEESGVGFAKAWGQRIEVTKDKIVTQGSHTVLALREVGEHFDDDTEIEVFYAKIDGKVAEGKDDAKWCAAQANKKGIDFTPENKSTAINFLLDQMHPFNDKDMKSMGIDKELHKRDFITERPLAVMVGCSRTQVNRVRDEWHVKNGYKIEETKEDEKGAEDGEKKADGGKELTKEERLEKKLQEAKEKGKKPKAKKPKDHHPNLDEDIDDLNSFDASEKGDDKEVNPMDSDTVTEATDAPEPNVSEDDIDPGLDEGDDDLDLDEDMREKHLTQFDDRLSEMLEKDPDMNIFSDIEVLIVGKDSQDKGVLRDHLKDYSSEEVEMAISFLKWAVHSVCNELAGEIPEDDEE